MAEPKKSGVRIIYKGKGMSGDERAMQRHFSKLPKVVELAASRYLPWAGALVEAEVIERLSY